MSPSRIDILEILTTTLITSELTLTFILFVLYQNNVISKVTYCDVKWCVRYQQSFIHTNTLISCNNVVICHTKIRMFTLNRHVLTFCLEKSQLPKPLLSMLPQSRRKKSKRKNILFQRCNQEGQQINKLLRYSSRSQAIMILYFSMISFSYYVLKLDINVGFLDNKNSWMQ